MYKIGHRAAPPWGFNSIHLPKKWDFNCPTLLGGTFGPPTQKWAYWLIYYQYIDRFTTNILANLLPIRLPFHKN